MTSIRTLTTVQTIEAWLELLPDGKLKTQALEKLSPKCKNMERKTILEAILCARSYRESIEIANDQDDWWMQLHDEIKNGNY